MTLRTLLKVGVTALALFAAAPAAADVQYVYDSSGRLIKAIYSNGVTIQYRYDAAGNRTQIVTANTPNSPPVAVNDSASVNASGAVNIQVLNNDSDPDGNSLTISAASVTTGGGSVSRQGGNTYLRFTAPATTGASTLSYTILDGAGGAATASVTVTISSANAAPVAGDDYASTTVSLSQSIFVLSNDTDANGHTLTVTGVSNVTGGSATVPSGGAYVDYMAPAMAGSYSFTYTVSDGNGGTDTGLVTIDVGLGEECVPTSENQCEVGP